MSGRLKDKIIILTGASGLIGKATQEHLLSNEAKVVSVDKNSSHNPENLTYNYDITNEKEIDLLLTEVVNTQGRIDGLVNLAYPRTKDWGLKFEDIPLESWRTNVDMQLNSVFYICQQVLEIMRKQQKGSIVNIASTRAFMSEPDSEAYAASKGGIVSLTHALAASLAKDHIQVNCISPGWIETGNYALLTKDDHSQHFAGRVGKPEDIANACLYLTSDGNDFISGTNIVIDGGMTKKMIYL